MVAILNFKSAPGPLNPLLPPPDGGGGKLESFVAAKVLFNFVTLLFFM